MALKDTEFKEVISYLGINPDEVDSVDKAKELISESFIRKSQIKESDEFRQATGSAFGSINTALKRMAKGHGIELEPDVIQGKKVEEIISLVDNKINEVYTGKIAEVEQKAALKPTEREREWEEKYGKLNQKYTETAQLLNSKGEEIELVKKNARNEINTFKINDASERALSGIKFSDDVKKDALKMTGFKALLSSKYAADIDEEGKPYIMSRETGQRIPNPKVHGQFLGLEDVYKLEAEQNNLIQKVDDNQKKTNFVQTTQAAAPVVVANTTPNRRITYAERTQK